MAHSDGNSDGNGTGRALVALSRPDAAPSNRGAPEAAFVSQLIAERDHLPPQRTKRRAAVSDAVGAYDHGSKIAVVRLPAGYRTTLVA
jgi:hypothetical protein